MVTRVIDYGERHVRVTCLSVVIVSRLTKILELHAFGWAFGARPLLDT